MQYVIDACNLIFSDRRLEEALERHGFVATKSLLVAILARFARAAKLQEVVAVFDGSEKAMHRPRIQREALGKVVLIYADPREKADQYIIDLVTKARQPGEITVVSNDKFVVREAQRAKGHTLSCREFQQQMREALRRAADPLGGEDPRKFGGPLTQREIEDWMKWIKAEEGGDKENRANL